MRSWAARPPEVSFMMSGTEEDTEYGACPFGLGGLHYLHPMKAHNFDEGTQPRNGTIASF